MGRDRYQEGSLVSIGKRVKKWRGHFYVYEKQADGSEKRRFRNVLLGLKSEMDKGQSTQTRTPVAQSVRAVPISPRVRSILEMRRTGGTSEWVFPAPTKSGHIESSSLKKQHAEAGKASGVVPFVLYTFRHTCITRCVLAGHTDMNTTKRYVHPSDEDILEAMERVRGGHKYGHTLKIADPAEVAKITGKVLNGL